MGADSARAITFHEVCALWVELNVAVALSLRSDESGGAGGDMGGGGLGGGGGGGEEEKGGGDHCGTTSEAKSTGNHCGGMALRSDERTWAVFEKFELGLDEIGLIVLVPVLPARMRPCAAHVELATPSSVLLYLTRNVRTTITLGATDASTTRRSVKS